MAEINYNALSNDDLQALSEDRYSDMSEAGLRVIANQPYDTSEVLGRSIEREAGASIRGIAEFMGYVPSLEEYKADFKREQEYRAMQELNPGAAITGGLAGSVLDPTNLIPLGTAKTVAQFIKQGAAVGGVTGLLQPQYEQFDDSRAFNTIVGAAGGGVIGGGLGVLARKLSGKTTKEVEDTLVQDAQDSLNAAISPSSKPRYKAGYVDANGNLIPIEPATTAVDIPTPTFNSLADQAQKQANFADINAIPKLPAFLSGAAPKYGKASFDFSNDIERALYILGNPGPKSARHEDYMQWASKSLNMAEEDVMKLAKQAHTEIKMKAKNYLIDQGTKGVAADVIPLKFTKALDNIINPITKHLDDESKMVYNYGKILEPDAKTGKIRINPTDPGFKGFIDGMKKIDPNISSQDAVLTAKGYHRLMNHMKDEYGPNFTSRNIREFMQDKEYNMDAFIVAAKRGDFDGCSI